MKTTRMGTYTIRGSVMYCHSDIPCTFNITSGLNITSVVPLSILHCTAELLFSTEARIESVDVLIPPIPKVVCDISRWAREIFISSVNWICHCGSPPWTVHLKWDVEPRDAFIAEGILRKPTWIFRSSNQRTELIKVQLWNICRTAINYNVRALRAGDAKTVKNSSDLMKVLILDLVSYD